MKPDIGDSYHLLVLSFLSFW